MIPVLVAIIVGLFTIYMPIYGLGLLSLIFMIHGMLVDLIGSSASHLPLYCGLTALPIFFIKKRIHIQRDIRIILILSLIGIMFVATLFSEGQRVSLSDLLLYMKSFFLAIFVFFVISESRDFEILSKFILLGALIGALAIVYQYATDTLTLVSGTLHRGASLSEDPNDTSRLLNMAVPIAVYWSLHSGKRRYKLLNMGWLVCILAAIILTKSRGGFVTLIVVLGILYIKNRSFKTTLVAILLLTGSIFFGVESLKTIQGQNRIKRDSSIEGRIDLLRTGLIIFKDNILIGSGPGQFGKKYLEYKTKRSLVRSSIPRITPAAHNLYLEFAVENGILGISVLSIIFIYSLRGFMFLALYGPDHHAKELGIYLAIAFVSILVSGLFLSGGQNKPLWLMVGLGLAAYNLKKVSN